MNDYGFKFKIGQFVKHVGAVPYKSDNPPFWSDLSPMRLLVIERGLQECPGGVQRYYYCRSVKYSGHFHSEPFRLNEIELTEAEEPAKE